MDGIDSALEALRAARVALYEASQKHEALLRRRPPPLQLIAQSRALVDARRADLKIAREAAGVLIAAMGE